MNIISALARTDRCYLANAFVLIGFYFISIAGYSQIASSASLKNNGIVSVRSSDIFLETDNSTTTWLNEPLPISFYSDAEIALQKTVNKKVSDAIVAYSPESQIADQTSIDLEDITPYTWKWIKLELCHDNGNKSTATLRRPNWWIKNIGADSIGKKVFINMPEMGMVDSAVVTEIYANQLDTRFWDESREGDFVIRPITGKFLHKSKDVYNLYFEGDGKPLGVTANHPIWSMDRNQWVAANMLSIGERVRSNSDYSKLVNIEKRVGLHTVYNVEVYKDHNYFVSVNTINVHNGCWEALTNLARKAPMRSLAGKIYGVQYATEKVGDVFRISLFYIERLEGPRRFAKAAGEFSEAMEAMMAMAKSSGAKKVEMLVYNVRRGNLKGYYAAMEGKFEGITVKKISVYGNESFEITGDVAKIKPKARAE